MTTKTKKRYWFALTSILLAPAAMLWAAKAEVFYRHWIYLTAPILSLLLLGVWWSLVIGVPWKTKAMRLGISLATIAALVFTLTSLAKLQPSTSGSSLPRLAWKWDKEKPVAPPPPTTTKSPATTSPLPGAKDMPTFLGPDRDGSIQDIALAPSWDTSPPQEIWRQPIGQGWASFAVQGRHAITTEQRGDDEWTTCYDLGTGAQIWKHVHPETRFSEPMGGDGPRSTPTIHRGKVYTLGATGILDCLDLQDGTLLWSRHTLDDAGAPNLEWATTASPLIAGENVVVSGGQKTGPELLAYSLQTGEPTWQNGSNGGSYSSPRLVEISGQPAILHVHGAGVAAHSPATGKKLWDHPWGNHFPKVAQPHLLPKNRILVTASYNQGTHLLQIEKESDSFTVTPIWESSRMKTKFSSATVIGDHAYGLDEGTLACIDLATGDRLWKDGRYGFGQHLHVGQHLLMLAERGKLLLIKPGPSGPQELAQLQVFDTKCWAAPTLAGAYCLLRSETEIACLKLPVLQGSARPPGSHP